MAKLQEMGLSEPRELASWASAPWTPAFTRSAGFRVARQCRHNISHQTKPIDYADDTGRSATTAGALIRDHTGGLRGQICG